MARARLHQTSQQLSQRGEIHRATLVGVLEDLIQERAQTRSLGLIYANIVRADVFVPMEPRMPTFRHTRIPLRHEMLEILPESLLLR